MNAVQCDYCGKFAPNPVDGRHMMGRYTNKLPGDWYGVGAWQGGIEEGGSYSETGEFCSRECISAHFAKHLVEAVA